MTRFLLIIIAVLVIAVASLSFSNKSLRKDLATANNKIGELTVNFEGCRNEISKYNRAQERAAQTIEKVRTVVRTVKSDCDCYNTAIPDDVRRLLNGGK